MAKKYKTIKCWICNEVYEGFGHNAQPVNNGRCSDVCQDMIVMPTRMQHLYDAAMKNVAKKANKESKQ